MNEPFNKVIKSITLTDHHQKAHQLSLSLRPRQKTRPTEIDPSIFDQQIHPKSNNFHLLCPTHHCPISTVHTLIVTYSHLSYGCKFRQSRTTPITAVIYQISPRFVWARCPFVLSWLNKNIIIHMVYINLYIYIHMCILIRLFFFFLLQVCERPSTDNKRTLDVDRRHPSVIHTARIGWTTRCINQRRVMLQCQTACRELSRARAENKHSPPSSPDDSVAIVQCCTENRTLVVSEI